LLCKARPRIFTLSAAPRGANVFRLASDSQKGDILIRQAEFIHISSMLTVGYAENVPALCQAVCIGKSHAQGIPAQRDTDGLPEGVIAQARPRRIIIGLHQLGAVLQVPTFFSVRLTCECVD